MRMEILKHNVHVIVCRNMQKILHMKKILHKYRAVTILADENMGEHVSAFEDWLWINLLLQ